MLQAANLKTPIGTLYLIADEQVLLGAGFYSLDNLISRLDQSDFEQEIRNVKQIPKISDLISDYFDGDLNAMNN